MTKFNLEIITKEEKELVNARNLHKALEIKTEFKDWFPRRIIDINLKENIDYVKLKSELLDITKFQPLKASRTKEYGLTQISALLLCAFEKGELANQVRDYIKDLYENRNKHLIPQSLSDALLLAGNLAKEKEDALLQVEVKQALLEKQEPLVSIVKVSYHSKETKSILLGQYAKTIDINPKEIYPILRKLGIILKNSTAPKQELINKGVFTYKKSINSPQYADPTTRVTVKGQAWLTNHLLKKGIIKPEEENNFNVEEFLM